MHGLKCFSIIIITIILSCTRDLPTLTWNNPVDPLGHNYIKPVVTAPALTIVHWDQEATISVSATDSNGTVKKYIWKSSDALQWDTTKTPVYKVRHPMGGKITVTVGAIDNDGLVGYSQAAVLFDRRPESISLAYPYAGKLHVFDKIDFSDTIGAILAYGLTAVDPDGSDDSLRYSIEVSDTAGHKTRLINNASDSTWIDSLLPRKWYRLVYKAYDRYGDSITSERLILTQDYFPGDDMVYFPREPEHGINHPFWISKTEMTVREARQYKMDIIEPSDPDFPASFHNSNGYVDRWWSGWGLVNILNKKPYMSAGFRAPSYAEWTRASKNPNSSETFYWGDATHQDVVKKYAWYNLNTNSSVWTEPHAQNPGIQKGGQLLPNEYGLYDMFGNVGEYITDGRYCGGCAVNSIQDLKEGITEGWTSTNYPFLWIGSKDLYIGLRKVYGQIE